MVAVFGDLRHAERGIETSRRWASAWRSRSCIDATIVRAVLLPATMKLLGKWNWYLPSKLNWLPKLSHEPTLDVAPAPA